MRLQTRTLGAIALTFSLLVITPTAVSPQVDDTAAQQDVVRRPMAQGRFGNAFAFARTELFFGTAKPDGTAVTPEQFQAFIDAVVTPRFPDGLTVLAGNGQFRDSSGVILKEQSFVLILLYPIDTAVDSSRRIEAIRRMYKAMFQQESVLRADDPAPSRVSF